MPDTNVKTVTINPSADGSGNYDVNLTSNTTSCYSITGDQLDSFIQSMSAPPDPVVARIDPDASSDSDGSVQADS